MANKYCNLVPTNKIKNEYNKINDGFGLVDNDVIAVGERIDRIIIEGDPDKDPEVVDARYSEEYGLFSTVKLRIDNEEAGRVAADETLQDNIDAEASARAAADTSLGNLISTNTTNIVLKANVAQAAWTAPTLLNSWVNEGSIAAGYYKDTIGTVHLKGRIKSGTFAGGAILFTLPAGYRPLENPSFTSSFYNGTTNPTCSILVTSSGNVTIWGVNANNFLDLNGITFKAEQ